MKYVLKSKSFNLCSELLDWVNKNLQREDVLTITEVGKEFSVMELWYWEIQ